MTPKSFLLAAAVFGTMTVFAQSNTGSVYYETTISFGDIGLSNVPADIAAMMPKETKEKNILHFTANNSLYETVVEPHKQNSDFSSDNGSASIKISINTEGAEGKTFIDMNAKKVVEQKDFMGKRFLINSQLEKLKWKITGRQKTILEYPAQEAMAIDDKDTTTAWFTTSIPVASGPEGIGGLPGLVLEAHIGSKTVISATKVDLTASVSGKISEPTKGKKVSAEEYKKIVEEKTAEMKEQFGGDGSNMQFKVISR